MNIQDEIAAYNVSRETNQLLIDFVALLQEWNNKMNLVSKNSMSDVWTRHVLDSMQLIKHIKSDARNVVDIGSGAGFPGVILAIMMNEKMPDAQVKLVESITKKTMYLKSVCAKLGLKNVDIINERVENTVFKGVDVITARAVASLDCLFGYAAKIADCKTQMIFPKGESYKTELLEAAAKWNFKYVVHKNAYHNDGVILEISELETKK